MNDGRLGVVLIHGILSDAKVRQPLEKGFVRTLPFEYATGMKQLHPLRVFPRSTRPRAA
ncbi:hypothetical protein [Streptomyces cinerochromogenes]|uniref:hypothetical protein n=1 Tax=Streptomyces cinerochromogenes TaxID=66422 RepID=UPI0033AC1F5A